MDAVTMLRDLWRHRYAVLGVLALSALAGILVLYQFAPPLQLKSRKYHVGLATTGVLIDTPSSQVATLAPEASGDLGVRASLLSQLMVDGTLKAKIAKGAGLDPRALFGISLADTNLPANAAPPRGASVLTTQVVSSDNAQLPLIQIEAQARDATAAIRLADAAVVGLRDYVDEQAASSKVPVSRRVRVTRIGATQAETAARGPRSVFAMAAGVLVFGLGCAVILCIAALVRGWRRSPAGSPHLPEVLDGRLTRPTASTEDPRAADPKAVGRSSLRSADGMQSAPAVRTSPLRPADDEQPSTQPLTTEDEGEPLRVAAHGKQKQRSQRARRRSAS